MNNNTTEYTSSYNPVSTDDEFNMIFLDTKAVAQYLGCSLPTARQIMYRSDFPLIKVGKNLRVERSALKKWAQDRHVWEVTLMTGIDYLPLLFSGEEQ